MIKPGDLVMLVWACCPKGRQNIGWTGAVRIIEDGTVFCTHCNKFDHGVYVEVEDGNCFPRSWLIKLDPPGVTTEKRETVEAT